MDRRPSKPRSPRAPRSAAANGDLLRPDILDEGTALLMLGELRGLPQPPPASSGPRPSRAGESASSPSPKHRPLAVAVGGGAGSPASLGSAPAGGGGREDLVTAMAARLGDLEKKHKVYQKELAEMHEKHRTLHDRFQKECRLREDAEGLVVMLYEEKESMEKELTAVKQFLADYGLHWRGDDAGEEGARRQKQTEDTPAPARAGVGSPRSIATRLRLPPRDGGGQGPAAKAFDLYEGDFTDGTEAEATAAPPRPPVASETPPQLYNDSPPGWHHRAKPLAGPPDMALLRRHARVLSDHVGVKGVVVTEGKRAIMRDREVVTVVLYQNGICVNAGAFRPYGWALCDAFLEDLMEGFYPYEFKDRYPEGFPIEVVDRTRERCEAGLGGDAGGAAAAAAKGTPPAPASGAGRRLGSPLPGSGPAAPPAGPTAPNIHTLPHDGSDKGYAAVSKEEFLNRLPAQRVTPDGKLVNVREGVARLWAGPTTPSAAAAAAGTDVSTTVRHVSAAEAAYRSASPDSGDGDGSRPSGLRVGDLVAVLIRLPSGQKVTLNVPEAATIQEVRRELAVAVPDFTKQTAYELCQAFPYVRVFNEHAKTLKDLGLSKTCTMMVKIVSS